jgi:hypothetical protein
MAMYENFSVERLSGAKYVCHILTWCEIAKSLNGPLQLAILVPLKSGFRQLRAIRCPAYAPSKNSCQD